MGRTGFLGTVLIVSCLAAGRAFAMELTSRDITEGEPIADVFTCMGRDISPHLAWEGVPEGTQSFALICDDPDAPGGTWVHWVFYNIPADVRELEQGVSASEALEDGSMQGMTDFRRVGYGGPCPPPGKPHHYIFTLYALDTVLPLGSRARKDEVVAAMRSHILDKVPLTGTYKR